jgi:putative addiction module component (TIGR02574 family)
MPTDAKAILEAALRLPHDERALLANRLLESLEPVFASPEIEAAWAAEIKRRLDDLDSGREKTIPWEQARRMIFEDEDASDAD